MRDDDPTTGRYIQADPLGLVDGAPVYGYARQNPGVYSDFTGECPWCAAALILGTALFWPDAANAPGPCDEIVERDPFAPYTQGNPLAGLGREVLKKAFSKGLKSKGPKGNNDVAKKHGGSKHDEAIDERINELRKDPGVSDIRKNQAQVDVDGTKVGNNRPDVQYNKDGCHHCVEFDNRQSASKKQGEQSRSNDPNTKIELNILPK